VILIATAAAEEDNMVRPRSLVLAAIAFAGMGLVVAPSAHAQVEPGTWISYSPTYTEQERGCGQISGLTFQLTCSTASGDQRAERRYATYSSGVRQFQGSFRITSLAGTRISLKQTFNDSTPGPYFMLAVERGGRLYAVEGGQTIATGATVGTTVRVNTVHQIGNNLKTYINGSLKSTVSSPGGSFYDKFGSYRTASGQGPATVVWSGIHFWRK
jgi:hypothetical protein